MEQKLVRVPFNIDMAKKITNGEIEGKIVTRDGRNVRIVCFDARMDDNIVALIENEEGVEFATTFNYFGQYFLGEERPYDLFLEIPEYLTFKEGDVIGFGSKCVGIFKNIDFKRKTFFSYATFFENQLTFYESGWVLKNSHIATESEKQRLIEALKESTEERAKECLEMLGIENSPKLSNSSKIGKNFELNPFDKVLVRQSKADKWEAMLFSNYTSEKHAYRCMGMNYMFCIPYEGNEHLLNTTNDYKEE